MYPAEMLSAGYIYMNEKDPPWTKKKKSDLPRWQAAPDEVPSWEQVCSQGFWRASKLHTMKS
jgi:hypothetical protein